MKRRVDKPSGRIACRLVGLRPRRPIRWGRNWVVMAVGVELVPGLALRRDGVWEVLIRRRWRDRGQERDDRRCRR